MKMLGRARFEIIFFKVDWVGACVRVVGCFCLGHSPMRDFV